MIYWFGRNASANRLIYDSYGERGLIAIERAVIELFPGLAFTNTNPFSPSIFVEKVLVPEAGRLLVMDDLGLDDANEAMEVLVQSRAYGILKHPYTGQDDAIALAHRVAEGRIKRLEEEAEAIKQMKAAKDSVVPKDAKPVRQTRRAAAIARKLASPSPSPTPLTSMLHTATPSPSSGFEALLLAAEDDARQQQQ